MPLECGHGQTQVRVFEPLLRQAWHAHTAEAVCAYCHGEPSGPDGRTPGQCGGRPAVSKGQIQQGSAYAQHNIQQLLPYARQGVPIAGIEPSCILTLREDYLDLVPGADTALVAQQVCTIDEFLYQLHQRGELDLEFTNAPKHLLVHGHCHQKALVGTAPMLAVLRLPAGYNVQEIPSGCCGMAGSFGYEAGHYEGSMRIGSQRLFPGVQAADSRGEIVAA